MRTVWHGSEAEIIAMRPHPPAALISITEPGRIAPLPFPDGWHSLLRVQFADAEYDLAMIERLRRRGIAFDPRCKGFPHSGHAEQLRAFISKCTELPISGIFVHCHAGQRRSAAVAQYVCDMWGCSPERPTRSMNRTVYALLHNPACFERSSSSPGLHTRALALVARLFNRS